MSPHPHPWVSGYNHSRALFCPQHTSTLGSVFGDAYYEQQMTTRQANALSRQVSGYPGLWAIAQQDQASQRPVYHPRLHCSAHCPAARL